MFRGSEEVDAGSVGQHVTSAETRQLSIEARVIAFRERKAPTNQDCASFIKLDFLKVPRPQLKHNAQRAMTHYQLSSDSSIRKSASRALASPILIEHRGSSQRRTDSSHRTLSTSLWLTSCTSR